MPSMAVVARKLMLIGMIDGAAPLALIPAAITRLVGITSQELMHAD